MQVLTEGQSVVYDYEGTNMFFTVTSVLVIDKLSEQVRLLMPLVMLPSAALLHGSLPFEPSAQGSAFGS